MAVGDLNSTGFNSQISVLSDDLFIDKADKKGSSEVLLTEADVVKTLMAEKKPDIAEATAMTPADTPKDLDPRVREARSEEVKTVETVRALDRAVASESPENVEKARAAVLEQVPEETLSEAGRALLDSAQALSEAPAADVVESTVAAEAGETPVLERSAETVEHLLSANDGIIGDQTRTTAEMEKSVEALDKALEARASAEEAPVDDSPVVSTEACEDYALVTAARREDHTLGVRRVMDESLQKLDDALRIADPEERLEELEGIGSRIQDSAIAESAAEVLASGSAEPQEQLAALLALRNSDHVLGSDLTKLQNRWEALVTNELRERLGTYGVAGDVKSAFSKEAVTALVHSASAAGVSPSQVFEAMLQGVDMPGRSPSLSADLLKVLTSHLVSADHTTTAGRMETCRMIDMVFQGGYPERADSALVLKQALTGSHPEEASMQHSLLLAHQKLASQLLDAQPGKGLQQKAALERASMPGRSMRSFMLTPEIVSALVKAALKTEVNDVNFRIANLAVLEMEAVKAGVAPLNQDSAGRVQDARAWCESLGLDEGFVKYAGEVQAALEAGGDEAAKLMGRLTGAAADFGKGFEGEAGLLKTEGLIRRQAGRYDAKHADNVFRNAPGYLAGKALNTLVANLSGLIFADDRLTNPADGLAVDGEAIEGAMRARMALLQSGLEGREKLNAMRTERDRFQKDLVQGVATFRKNADVLSRLARNADERVEFRSQKADIAARRAEHKANMNGIGFSWPHSRSERREAARTVLEFARLKAEVDRMPEGAERTEDLERLQGLREKLAGCDPVKLVSASSRCDRIPTDEVILKEMLPRAQALAYFDKRVEGKSGSDANADMLKSVKASLRLDKLSAQDWAMRIGFKFKMGRKNMKEIAAAASAAVLKVYVESNDAREAFSLRHADAAERVAGQLRVWGLDPTDAVLSPIIRREIDRMTLPDGTLNPSVLAKMADDTKVRFAGKEVTSAWKDELKEANVGFFARRRAVKAEISPQQAIRREGVARLMDGASQPGGSVGISFERGFTADTAATYKPWSRPGRASSINLLMPISARFSVMRNDSLAVTNKGDGFEVLIKGGLAASIGASVALSLGHARVALGADGGSSSAKGVAFSFSSRADAERFLEAVMTPKSDLTNRKSENYDPSVWLNASDIRLVTERGVSGNVSAMALADLVPALGAGSVLAFAGGGVKLAGGVERSQSINAHGEVNTYRQRGTVTASVSLLKADTAGLTVSGSIHYVKELQLVTNEDGVSPQTNCTTKLSVGAGLNRLELFKHAFTAAEATEMARCDDQFAGRLQHFLGNLKPGSNVIVRRGLKPEVLKTVQNELIAARQGAPADRKAAIARVNDLLGRVDSYRPERLTVVDNEASKLSRTHSPGIAFMQALSRSTYNVTNIGGSLEIKLD